MTLLDFALITCAALSLHRIWNYEPICAWLKGKVKNIKALSCPACNAFWIGVLAGVLWLVIHPLVLAAIALYLPVRIAVWFYERPVTTPSGGFSKDGPKTVEKAAPLPAVSSRSVEKTVVVMTALGDLRSSYSVAQESVNTAKAIAMANPNWDVQLWTMTTCPAPERMPANMRHRPLFTPVLLEEDKENQTSVVIIQKIMAQHLPEIKSHVEVITEDLLFVSWFLNFARAIHNLPHFPNIRWWHVCHSTAHSSTNVPEARRTLPSLSHNIVTVAESGTTAFREYYNTDRVDHVPNVRDPRTLGLSEAVQKIVSKMQLWDADVVQIFPACSTRLEAKGIVRLAKVFACLNKHRVAKLVVCNPNAIGNGKVIIERVKSHIRNTGLSPDKWCLTSEVLPETAEMGLPSKDITDLMMFYGNTFVMPSYAEADSLTILEARLARQFVMVNASVPNMVGGTHSVFWGNPADISRDETNAEYAAQRTLDHLAMDYVEQSRRLVLRMRNLEVIGHRWGRLFDGAGPSA